METGRSIGPVRLNCNRRWQKRQRLVVDGGRGRERIGCRSNKIDLSIDVKGVPVEMAAWILIRGERELAIASRGRWCAARKPVLEPGRLPRHALRRASEHLTDDHVADN